MRAIPVAVLAVPLFLASAHAQTISATEASQHVGERVTVCGRVAGRYTASTSPGTPTFVNLEKPRSSPLTLLIWRDDRSRVGRVPESGPVCATGLITAYRGTPEIVLHDARSWYVPK
jgi:hypothetical protein